MEGRKMSPGGGDREEGKGTIWALLAIMLVVFVYPPMRMAGVAAVLNEK